MEIIEYQEKYLEEMKDLLVELEEYIVSIDEDHLDQIGEEYREKMVFYDLEEVKNNNGKCYLAINNDRVVGLIMGIIRKWEAVDYLDYKCPKTGCVTELVVSKNIRSKGIGSLLLSKMEEYFKSVDCEYITIDVFAYNKNALNFYSKFNYHPRMITTIKKID